MKRLLKLLPIIISFLHDFPKFQIFYKSKVLKNGNFELENGNLILAEDLFNKALKIDPSFAPALKSLSKLYLHKGNLKKANEYSIEAVQKDEDFREWSNVIAKISAFFINLEENLIIYVEKMKQLIKA